MNRTIYAFCLMCFSLFAITGCGDNTGAQKENGDRQKVSVGGPDFSRFIGSFEEQDSFILYHNICVITEEEGTPYLRVLNRYTADTKGFNWSKLMDVPMKAGDTTTESYGPLVYEQELKQWIYKFHRRPEVVSLEGENTLVLKDKKYRRIQ